MFKKVATVAWTGPGVRTRTTGPDPEGQSGAGPPTVYFLE